MDKFQQLLTSLNYNYDLIVNDTNMIELSIIKEDIETYYEIKLIIDKKNNTFDIFRKFYDDYFDEELNKKTEDELIYYFNNLPKLNNYSPQRQYEDSIYGCCSGPIVGYFNIYLEHSLITTILNAL